ncbi:hypothetical protein [Kytococcus sedentarius]|uniref:hypothetical protein n=1 Tax=Kytococcus sedentarius TaxID=1276 RepID=UPI0035BBC340
MTRNERQPKRPTAVPASAALMVLGAGLSLVWALGATQGWWIETAGLVMPTEDTERLREAAVRGWTGDAEQMRQVVNGTSLVLGVSSALMWLTGAVVTLRGGVPNRGIVVGFFLTGLIALLSWTLGGGVAHNAAMQVLAAVMLGVGVVATGLLFLPASSRWFDSFTMYQPLRGDSSDHLAPAGERPLAPPAATR